MVSELKSLGVYLGVEIRVMAMDSILNIKKPDRTDWSLWKLKMKDVLVLKDLHVPIEEKNKKSKNMTSSFT